MSQSEQGNSTHLFFEPSYQRQGMNIIRRYVPFFGDTTPQISVSQLWIYPLKSARGIRVDLAVLSALGFEYDRVFMLVEAKPLRDDSSKPQWSVMTLRTWPKVNFPCFEYVNN